MLIPAHGAPEDLLLSPKNLSLLEPIREVLQSSSVVILDPKSKSQGYGILASDDGYILTKASLLHDLESFSLQVGRKQYTPKLLDESREWDLALLKIPLENGTPVKFLEKTSEIGEIIASNGVTSLLNRRLKFGVISTHPREIPMRDATLDFLMYYDEDKKGFMVQRIKENGASQTAGLKKGDLILSIDGRTLSSSDIDLSNLYRGKWPDDLAEVKIKRNNREQTLKIPYQWQFKAFPNPMDRNDAMSGRISGRRTGFPSVIQHDIALSARSVGGPVLDLEGNCIGMNIARYSRSETYALPASALKALLTEWFEAQETSIETGQ